MSPLVALALLALSVGIGALLQRISGMGLGLITAPVLMLVFGPVEGILIVNVLATINAAASTTTLWRDVNWRNVAIIAPALIVGIIPGAILVREVPTDPLLILVGLLLLLALSIVTLGKRFVPNTSGVVPAGIAGILGGFMNALAGAAGPAITVYAQAARWDQREYAATLQPLFFVAGLGSLLIKVLVGAGDLGSTNVWVWPIGVVALTVGLIVGVKVAPRVSKSVGRTIALSLAVVGGVTAVVRGALGLLG